MQLTIEKLVYGGDGLARVPTAQPGAGKSVFVPFVLGGERVEATLEEEKPGFARARLESVLESSPDRVEPACPYFQRCGGCHYQHAAYRRQLAIKAAVVGETLARTAKLELPCELKIHAAAEWNYRNRTRLQVRTAPSFALGYFRLRSHELMPVEQCPISSPLINRAIGQLWASEGKGIGGEMREIELFVNDKDDVLVAAAYCAPGTRRRTARQLVERLEQLLPAPLGVTVFAQDPERRVPELTWLAESGSPRLVYETQHHRYKVSAASFFQVNRFLIDELVVIVTRDFSGTLALDVYAGVGLFSAILARRFPEVIAVEASPTAYRDLRQNVPEGVKVVQASADEFLTRFKGARPDLVIVDPPRAGLGRKVVQDLVRLGSRIAYVSCDPATLARDLAMLRDSGYRIEEAHLIDLFPQTYHIESVFHLTR